MPRLDAVVDLSHHQSNVINFTAVKNAGVIGVIHKATQGTGFFDAQYSQRRDAALAAGLLWGAYHFGEDSSSGADQADFFLSHIGDPTGVFVCLDFESYFKPGDPVTPHTMALADAHDFIDRVFKTLGRLPFFYSGSTIRNLLGKNIDPKLAACKLWLAGYVSESNLRVQVSWPNWTMWQYTDGVKNGPKPIPGQGSWDRSVFDGTDAQLRAIWAS